MKILAVYGSNYGQAEAVLRRVSAVLEARGHAVSVFKGDAIPAALEVEDFDGVVVAASIVVGNYQAYIREFVKRHITALGDRPTAFVSVNGASPESMPEWRAEAERYVQQFLKETGWNPRWTAAFSGGPSIPALRPRHPLDHEDDQSAAWRAYRHLGRLRVHRLERGRPVRGESGRRVGALDPPNSPHGAL